MSFDPTTSILAGMSPAALQTALTNAQQAYLDLSSGAKIVTVSYTQGDGAKAVTYDKTNIGTLSRMIRLLQAQLGIICRPTEAIFPIF